MTQPLPPIEIIKIASNQGKTSKTPYTKNESEHSIQTQVALTLIKKDPFYPTEDSRNSRHWEHVIAAQPKDNNKQGINALERLKNQGFYHLAEKLKLMKDPPWEDIINLDNPLLIEQLYHVHQLLLTKEKFLQGSSKQIFSFAVHLAFSSKESTVPLLGKLVTLLNEDPQNVLNNGPNIEWIEKEFKKTIDKIKNDLKIHRNHHAAAALQNDKNAYYAKLALEISKILATDTRLINVGIIDYLIQEFTSLPEKAVNQELSLSRALQHLLSQPNLREKIALAQKPSSSKSPANLIIQATLALSPKTPCTDLHAMRTILAGFLSHLRQGRDGSCFSIPLSICLLKNQPEHCIDDFLELLSSGKLSRTINNMTCDFPFLVPLNEHHLQRNLTIDHFGIIQSDDETIEITKAPNFLASLKAIGGDESLLMQTVQSFFKDVKKDQRTIRISIKDLLLELSKQAAANGSTGIGKLFLSACLAFETEEVNPLLSAWNNAIAGMAEADEGSMIRSAVVRTVKEILKTKFSTHDCKKQISKTLRQELIERIHLQYDPQIAETIRAHDQHSTEGAFVLYDKNHSTTPLSWVRIDNPQAFQSFIIRIIEESQKKLKENFDKLLWKNIPATFEKLIKYAATTEFLLDCLNAYYPPNEDLILPLKNYKDINFAPWVTKSGNNLNKVMQVYAQDEKILPLHYITPANGKELLNQLIDFCKHRKEKAPITSPVRIPGIHAFTLDFTHPSFISSWKEAIPTEVWVQKHLIGPGTTIANLTMDSSYRERVVQYLLNHCIHFKNKKAFLHNMKEISKESTTKEFRDQLLQLILTLESEFYHSPSQLILQLDVSLIKEMSEIQKNQFKEHVIYIADSNWAENADDLHFCFLVNPGSGEIELWAATVEGGEFYPVKQAQWMGNHIWEIFS